MKHYAYLALALASSLAFPVRANGMAQSRFAALEQPVRNQRPLVKSTVSSVPTKVRQQFPRLVPDDGREYAVVLEEDFSLVTAGSEHDPAPDFINNEYNMIPSSYTHTPGWGGRAVMAAGGAVCLGYCTDPYTGTTMTGQLETPELDLHRDQGKAYMSFRAKLLASEQFDMITVRWVAETDMLPISGEEMTFPVNGLQWTEINAELTDCPSNAVIQIFADEFELLVDDVKIEQYKAEIEAPTALKWTDYKGDSFTANWTEVPDADHYVFNCFYIRREGSEDQLPDYKYVARDVNVTGTSYHLSGLNRDRVYYYYVRAVSATGAKSEESQLVEVMDLTVPENVRVSEVTADGFLAQWDPVYNAEGYGFQVILDHTAPEAETYDLLNESFDALVNDGSVGAPAVNTIGLYDMDSFGMTRANWVMYEGGVINGGIALHNYVSSYGEQYYGELVSPVMTIGQSTGAITIEADFATLTPGVRPYIQIAVPGVVDGQTTWVLGAGGEVKTTIGKEWTHVELTYRVKPGLVRFSIGCTDGGWLYMDNLRIAVDLPENAVQRSLYKYDEIKDGLDAPEYYCPTSDRQRGDHFLFSLMAARQRPGSYMIPVYVLSDWTEIFDVPDDPEWGAIESPEVAAGEALSVSIGQGGVLNIVNPAASDVVVADMAGRTVGRTSASEASLRVAPGVYVVSAIGGKTVKVAVK